MATIKELLQELEDKALKYNTKHHPAYNKNDKQIWIKAIDPSDAGCILINESRTQAYKYNCIYVATLMLSTNQFFWGHTSGNLPQEMKDKTKKLIEVGESKRILEFMEGGLNVTPAIVEIQKINRAIDNEKMCQFIGQDFASKYTYPQLLAMSAKILKAESFLVLEYPEQDFNAFYFLYGEPEIINL
jgi:hypothetical protein